MGRSSLGKFSIDDLPIMRLGVAGKVSGTELYDLVKQRIQPSLSKIPGVAQVSLIGGEEREIRINVSNEKLKAYNISILQLQQLVENSNLDFPTGKIKTRDQQVLIRLSGKYTNLDEIRNLVVTYQKDGSPVKLSEVAEVQDAIKDAERINRIDLQNSIGIAIQKQSDANAVAVSEMVRKELAKIESTYAGQGIKFSIAQDSTTYTLEAADAVIHDLILAVVLVAAIMLLAISPAFSPTPALVRHCRLSARSIIVPRISI